MTDEDCFKIFNQLKDSDLVLDVGGWHAPLNRADYIIDLMPFATRNQVGASGTHFWPRERFTQETFIQQDICEGPWPFNDKQFDFVFCSNTVEDLRDPLAVCREMIRVGKAGFLEVPSRFVESTRGVERPFYCGYYHHRWLCEIENNAIYFQFKPAQLHAYRRFYFRKPWFKKPNPKYGAVSLFWTNSFSFQERILIERSEVQAELIRFKEKLKDLTDLFVPKYSWYGKRI